MYPGLVQLLVQILLIAGALNWGSVALVGIDFVRSIVGGQLDNYVKLAVGIAGAIAGMEFAKMKMKAPEASAQ